MRRVVIFTIVIYLLVAISHLIFWPVNKEIYHRYRKQHLETSQQPITPLKKLRIRIENQARKELSHYQWLDERKEYAQIPIERAFDYYLNHNEFKSKRGDTTRD